MGQAQQPAISATYGRYQTLFRIASGGMAEVYAARVRGEAGFQKLVALKRMLPHLTDDERFVNMFMDEGKLAANIDSPNVVSTLDLGRADDGSLYLVMELVVGTTLSTLLRNAAKDGESCSIDVACEIIAQAAQGLHDAHEAKTPFGAPLQLVHRDISPQNILVGVDGRVRITDFGVARAVLRRTKTSTGEFKGKLSYFSPEQCADKNLDRRSDVFSLGVVAWETLTTRRLFHAENPLAVLERVTRMPIPSAHTVRPEVPASVAAVVAMALERDRDARYGTAAEFAQALRAAARETVGTGDRHRVTELVERYGGDQLDRVQAKLKESLSVPHASLDDAPAEPTEVSSGIILRPEEGPVPSPATPKAQAPAKFRSPADSMEAAQVAEPKRKAPVYVAVAVAILGLGGGAAIGFLAGDPEGADAVEPTGTVAAEGPESGADDETAATPGGEAVGGGVSTDPSPGDEEPPTAPDDETAGDTEEQEAEAASASPTGRRGRARRGRRGRQTQRTREEDPSPPHVVVGQPDPAEAQAQADAEAARRERERLAAERERQERERRERERREREQQEQQQERRSPGGLRSVDDFMNEIGR